MAAPLTPAEFDPAAHPRKLNLGCGGGYSVTQVIETARAVTGRPIPCVVGSRRAGDPAVLVAASDRIHRELDWKARKPDLAAIIGDAWSWLRSRPDGDS